jgi:hypothetical protein
VYTNRPGEVVDILATIQPIAGTPGTFLSDAIALSSATGRRLWALIQCGAIGSSATVTASLVGSATSGGSYAAITGAALTADSTGGNVHTITAGIDWIKYVAPTVNFVKLQVVTATAATPISGIVLGFDCSNNPPANPAAAVTVNSQFNVTNA